MKKLTFCLFSANDTEGEPERVFLSLQSLLVNTENSCIIFTDCTQSGMTELRTPNHPDLKVIRRPTSIKKDWNPSVIRNEMALLVDTPIVCHVCADCVYSPNFADSVIKSMGEGNRFICCKRKDTNREQMLEILRGGLPIAAKMADSLPIMHPSAYGECQGMMLEQFLSRGGYYGMIQNGGITKMDWDKTAGCEDANMMMYIRHQEEFANEKHTIQEVWINGPNTWIIHLFHNGWRQNKVFFENNKNV